MIRSKEKLTKDLSRLITASCSVPLGQNKFAPIHKAFIKIAYDACDVFLDYERQRVHMNLITDYSNANAPTVPVNISYSNLEDFLKSGVYLNTGTMMQYTFLLMYAATKNTAYKSAPMELV